MGELPEWLLDITANTPGLLRLSLLVISLNKNAVRFEDVMVHFSREEFGMLERWQQELYFEVLMENCESLIFVGNLVTVSDVMAWFQRGEQQNCAESWRSRACDSSANGGLGQIYSKHYTKTQDLPKIIENRSEEEMALSDSLGGTPEDLNAPFIHQGSPQRDECMPHLEKAMDGLASAVLSQDAAVAPKPYECQECGDRFRLKGLLRIHQMVTLRKPALPCPVCGLCFPHCWHLERHQRIHRHACTDSVGAEHPSECQGTQAEERSHFCADCGESFHWYLSFLQHQKSHEEVKDWPCAQCDAAFLNQSDLAMHEESHLDEALCVPSPCGENCNCRLSFLLHFTSRPEKSTENDGTDPQEDEKLRWEGKSKREKPYSCHQCGERFRLEENLEKHYRYCYKGRLQKLSRRITPRHKWVRGKLVPKACRNRPNPLLQRSPARLACSHCDKSFSSTYCLFKHRQRHKAEGQSATERDKSVRPSSGFGGHALVGITKKLHKCEECGKSFALKAQLATHAKAHAQEGRCQYTLGGESSDFKDRFRKPLQISLGERAPGGKWQDGYHPLPQKRGGSGEEERCHCAECGKSFTKSFFPDHQAWHAGVRFMCLLCGKMANYKSGGYHHLQQHRKERDFTCPKCGGRRQSKNCLCLIEKIYLGQKPLPTLYK